MTDCLQPDCSKPLWVRLTALWCALMCLTVGIAQACHSHQSFAKTKRVLVYSAVEDGSGLEKICPLCTGLVFTTPQPLQAPSHEPVLRLHERALPRTRRVPTSVPFPLNSRPPPDLPAVSR